MRGRACADRLSIRVENVSEPELLFTERVSGRTCHGVVDVHARGLKDGYDVVLCSSW